MTTVADPRSSPARRRCRPCAPPTRAWPTPLESVLSDNTRRVYGTQWRLVQRLVRRGGSCVHAGGAPHRGPLPGRPRQRRRQYRHHAPGHVSAIAKAHEWAGHESPCRDRGVRAS